MDSTGLDTRGDLYSFLDSNSKRLAEVQLVSSRLSVSEVNCKGGRSTSERPGKGKGGISHVFFG